MKPHTTWLIANWKMNGTAAEVRDYAQAVEQALVAAPHTLACVYCPPTPYLSQAASALPTTARLKLGGQTCHAASKGAFTGEVSAAMLKDVGCTAVIVGHSERRAAGETDAAVLGNARAAVDAGLMPIICVGESLAEYEAGNTAAVLASQLRSLAELANGSYIIAYEPVWAIGSGKTPTCGEIEAAHATIKTVLGSQTSVLYGGSVNAGNVREILDSSGVSGVLIGSASLSISGMQNIIIAACG